MDFLEKLREYFNNNNDEKIKKDWEKSKEFDNIKPPFEDFINIQLKSKNDLNPYSPTANWVKPKC